MSRCAYFDCMRPWLSCVWMCYRPHLRYIRPTQTTYLLSFVCWPRPTIHSTLFWILLRAGRRKKKREGNNGISSLFYDRLRGYVTTKTLSQIATANVNKMQLFLIIWMCNRCNPLNRGQRLIVNVCVYFCSFVDFYLNRIEICER